MALLSFLGDEIVHEERDLSAADPLLTIISTRKRKCEKKSSASSKRKLSFVSVILAYANESFVGNEEKQYELVVKRLEPGKWKYAVYRLDNVHTNPYRIWWEMGQPVFPGKEERRRMREVEVRYHCLYRNSLSFINLFASKFQF